MRAFRLLKILVISSRYGLDEMVASHDPSGRLPRLTRIIGFWRRYRHPPAVRLRLALEALGPIFVKFGQVLSTRRDLLSSDYADELAKLQDRVPPFPGEIAIREIERVFARPIDQIFAAFDPTPIASASIAQVHFARLFDGRNVAVKVLRPNMLSVIDHDIGLLDTLARLIEMLWADGKRLKPREVVAEFAKHLHDELDLMREAANCSQLRRNFDGSPLLVVPEVYWDYCTTTVMTMERMHGTPISQIDALKAQGIDLTRLGAAGVEIFFTQVFRDGFFHADMHPGNIFVSAEGKYIALDFGIVATLTDGDKDYLAQNFLAFFKRDYKRVAMAHIEAGWAPADTRPDEFEAAIRAVCEPIFDRPLKEISFGKVLLRLFQTSRRFNVEVQPQLVMLQKTLLNIEGLGRQLDPDLDLWKTAKPFLEKWMSQQIGWRGVLAAMKQEAPHWSRTLPRIPRLIHQALDPARQQNTHALEEVAAEARRLRRWVAATVILSATLLALEISRWLR